MKHAAVGITRSKGRDSGHLPVFGGAPRLYRGLACGGTGGRGVQAEASHFPHGDARRQFDPRSSDAAIANWGPEGGRSLTWAARLPARQGGRRLRARTTLAVVGTAIALRRKGAKECS